MKGYDIMDKDTEKIIESSPIFKKVMHAVALFGLIVAVILSCWGLYRLYSNIHAPAPEKPSVSVGLDGKPSSEKAPQVIQEKTNTQVVHTFSYVPKEIDSATGQKEKTDVQLDSGEHKVYLKVNGRTTEVPVLSTENQKFEDGKLIVTENQKTNIEITGPEPSRWSASYLRSSEGKSAVGVSYALGKVVRADVMHVDGSGMFYGVTVNLGDLSSKDKKKDK